MTGVKARRAAKQVLPDFVPPCLAKLGTVVPEGPQWVHEIKFDGYRLQVHIEHGQVLLRTRTGLDWTARFGSLAAALQKLEVKSALIDGEAIVEDEAGAPSFSALVEALKSNQPGRIVFVAFDLLHLDGRDLTGWPLGERKELLRKCLQNDKARVRYSDHISGDGTKMFSEVCKLGLEGLISKRIDRPYRSGRNGDWRKTKCILTDEFVIVGYLDSTAVQESIGALAMGFFKGTKLIYAGRVGTGFNRQTAADLWRILQPLRTGKSPLSSPLDAAQRNGVKWVAPKLVAQLEYRTLTADGLLRHASFKALREDIPATNVRHP